MPKKILSLMGVSGLTRDNIASHLQKYRLLFEKRLTPQGGVQLQGGHATLDRNLNLGPGGSASEMLQMMNYQHGAMPGQFIGQVSLPWAPPSTSASAPPPPFVGRMCDTPPRV